MCLSGRENLHELTIVPRYDFLLTCAVCISVSSLTRGQQVNVRKHVTVHPLLLLFFSSAHHPATNLHLCTWPSDNIQRQQTSQPSSLSHWTSAVCVSVYWADYVRHQTVSDRRTSFHTWGDVGLLTARTPAKGLCFVNSAVGFKTIAVVWISFVVKKKKNLIVFYQRWMTLLKLTQVGQDIPWLHPLSMSISGSVTMEMAYPRCLSSDHYFLSGLGTASWRPAHSSVQPNWPNQTLGRGSGLPGLSRSQTDPIPVIVWALCFHSGISCALNHRDIWEQTTPAELPVPNPDILFLFAAADMSHQNYLLIGDFFFPTYNWTM